MGSAPGPEMRLPAVIHLPTLQNPVLTRAAGGCKSVMVHPRSEGFQSSLKTHAPIAPTPNLPDRSAGRSRKDAIVARRRLYKIARAGVVAHFGRAFGSGDALAGGARPQGSERKGSQTERLWSLAVAVTQKHRQGNRHNRGNRMPEEFARPNCDPQSTVCSDAANDDDRVVCPACGAMLATRAEFRRFVEWRATCSRLHTSGC
jgi:hypothetical protein